jgi:hypothetical protein
MSTSHLFHCIHHPFFFFFFCRSFLGDLRPFSICSVQKLFFFFFISVLSRCDIFVLFRPFHSLSLPLLCTPLVSLSSFFLLLSHFSFAPPLNIHLFTDDCCGYLWPSLPQSHSHFSCLLRRVVFYFMFCINKDIVI